MAKRVHYSDQGSLDTEVSDRLHNGHSPRYVSDEEDGPEQNDNDATFNGTVKRQIEPFIIEEYVPKQDDVSEPEDRCGILCFKPDFMQRFRNMKAFLLVFVVTGMAQGMYYSYWNMALSSIEKRFQIPSRTTGMITATNDISHLLVVLLVAHFCNKGHRPRWLAFGSFIIGLAITAHSVPELFTTKWDADILTKIPANLSLPTIDKDMCHTAQMANATEAKCDEESQSLRNDVVGPVVIMVIGQLMYGVGMTFNAVLILPFMDDNVKIKDAPIYYGLAIAGRFIGPTLGVVLGGFCLSTYVDLTKPNIAQNDPRWMGAWWLGFLIIGLASCSTSFLYLCFPKSLSPQGADRFEKTPMVENGKSSKSKKLAPDGAKSKLATLPRDIKRLLTNKTFMCRLANDCIDMLVVSGYYNYASKYMEFHFRISPSDAGRASGLTSIFSMCVGGVVGGILVKKLKFQPKQVAIMIMLTSFLTAVAYFLLLAVKCEPRVLHSTWKPDGMINIETVCSKGCNCADHSFSPVCDEISGINYYSPCHAGCTDSFSINETSETKYYSNCRCLVNSTSPDLTATPVPTVTRNPKYFMFLHGSEKHEPDRIVKRGFCEGRCDGFWTYVGISATFQFIGMMPFSGSQMLSFRIVEPDLKGLSKGLLTMCASIFAFIPGPIIMGALIDSTCKLWNKLTCDQKGACLIYDLDGFRTKMHLYVAVIKSIACLLDVYVYFRVKDMKFERQPTEPEEGTVTNLLAVGSTTGSVKDLTARM